MYTRFVLEGRSALGDPPIIDDWTEAHTKCGLQGVLKRILCELVSVDTG